LKDELKWLKLAHLYKDKETIKGKIIRKLLIYYYGV
jgi:hypothetical protein